MSQPIQDGAEYVLGVSAGELERLGFQHRFWSGATQSLWERAGVAPGTRVLDVGCGPGFTSMDLATLVGPSGRVDAVDEADLYVTWLTDQARKRGLTIGVRRGDVGDLAAAGFEPDAYDVAYARWVLCFVTDPRAVMASVARVLRPGGALVIQDYINYKAMSAAPASPIFDRIVAAICESWRRRGGDSDVMRRVPQLVGELGLSIEHVQPHLLAARPGTLAWEWPASFFRNFVPILETKGLVTADERREFEAEWARWSREAHVMVMTPTLVDMIVRKPS